MLTFPSAGETPLDLNFIDFFLKGNLSLEKARRHKLYEWLPDQGWQDLTRLVQIGSSKLNASGESWIKPCI
jgi:dynein heavy chain